MMLFSVFALMLLCQSLGQPSARPVLTRFYKLNNGTNWTHHGNWTVGSDVCTWFGVGCTNGNVTSLSLANQGLASVTFPSGFEQLSQLAAIDLSQNQLTAVHFGSVLAVSAVSFLSNFLETIPPTLDRLPNVTFLDFTYNSVHGDLSILCSLQQLQSLTLDYNRVEARFNRLRSLPASFGSLHQLTDLLLDDNLLTTLPLNWFSLPLETLSVANNRLEVLPLSIFEPSCSLSRLDASNNLLQSLPAEIALCTSLRLLSAGNNRLATLPANVTTLSLLELLLPNNQLTVLPDDFSVLRGTLLALDVTNNLLTDMPVSFLSGMTQLQTLDVAENRLTNLQFSGAFPILTKLDASANQLSDWPGGLHGQLFPQLGSITLTNCSLTDTTPNFWRVSTFTNLTVLGVSHNQLTFDQNDFCAAPCNLRILRASHNVVQSMPDLSCCSQLHIALFSQNLISHVPDLSNLTSLESLAIGAHLTDASIASLGRLPNEQLRVLDLSYNELNTPPAFLFNMSQSLVLHHNQIQIISHTAYESFFFGTNSWIDLSYNQLQMLPQLSLIRNNDSVPTPTLRTLLAAYNQLSGRVQFLPVGTLSLAGNPRMHVAGERLNPLPLYYDNNFFLYQELSTDAPMLFYQGHLICQTFYRDKQVAAVLTPGPQKTVFYAGAAFELLERVSIDLDPAYHEFRHCQCRETFWGTVNTTGGGCLQCTVAFPKVAICDTGGQSMQYQPGFSPIFRCSALPFSLDRYSVGGPDCTLAGFAPCTAGEHACNPNSSCQVVRNAQNRDHLVGEPCGVGYQYRLCSRCTATHYKRDTQCVPCQPPDLPSSTVILGCLLLLVGGLHVFLPVGVRRWLPLVTLISIGLTGVALYTVSDGVVVFGNELMFGAMLALLHLVRERTRRRSLVSARRDALSGLAAVLILLNNPQTLSAVSLSMFPVAASTTSTLSFAKPAVLGMQCILNAMGPEYAEALDAEIVSFIVALLVPFALMLCCCIVIVGRRLVIRLCVGQMALAVYDDELWFHGNNTDDDDDDDNDQKNDADVPPGPRSVSALTVTRGSYWNRLTYAAMGAEIEPRAAMSVWQSIGKTCLFIAHFSFFGAAKAILSNFSCTDDLFIDDLRWLDKWPWIPCHTSFWRYRVLLASSAVFGVVYLLVFPTLLAVLLRRHWQKYIANAPATMLDVNGGPNDDDNDIADAKAVPLDGEPVIDDNLPGSPLVSVVSSSMWDTVALPRRHGPLWYDMLISGWSQKQPFAELLWLARRFALATALAVTRQYSDAQLALVFMILGGSLLLQPRLAMFTRSLDTSLDNLAIWVVLAAYVLASHNNGARLDHWTFSNALMLGVAALTLVCFALALLWAPAISKLYMRFVKTKKQ